MSNDRDLKFAQKGAAISRQLDSGLAATTTTTANGTCLVKNLPSALAMQMVSQQPSTVTAAANSQCNSAPKK